MLLILYEVRMSQIHLEILKRSARRAAEAVAALKSSLETKTAHYALRLLL